MAMVHAGPLRPSSQVHLTRDANYITRKDTIKLLKRRYAPNLAATSGYPAAIRCITAQISHVPGRDVDVGVYRS